MKTYKCDNCGKRHTVKWITAMIKAGFGLHQLACRECGQQTIMAVEK